MEVLVIPIGPYQVNCCIAWHPDTKQALVIDPGFSEKLIGHKLEENGLSVAAYIVTHGHADHINALATLHKTHPAPVIMHEADIEWAFGPDNIIPDFYPVPQKPEKIEVPVHGGEERTDGGLTYRIIATPGHAPGCICIHFPEENVLFSGDTLFPGSVGRTDLPRSDSRQLNESLKKLSKLPPETVIYPGHGPMTKMAVELESNFFLQRLPK